MTCINSVISLWWNVFKNYYLFERKKQNFEDIFESRKFHTGISMRSYVKYEITQNRTRHLHHSSFTYHEKIEFSYLHLVRRKYKIIHDHRSIRYPNIFTMIYDAWLFYIIITDDQYFFWLSSEYEYIKKMKKKKIYIYIYIYQLIDDSDEVPISFLFQIFWTWRTTLRKENVVVQILLDNDDHDIFCSENEDTRHVFLYLNTSFYGRSYDRLDQINIILVWHYVIFTFWSSLKSKKTKSARASLLWWKTTGIFAMSFLYLEIDEDQGRILFLDVDVKISKWYEEHSSRRYYPESRNQ